MLTAKKRRQLFLALPFLAPNLAGFLVFTLGPIVASLGGSFTTWSLRPSVGLEFIGLRNYFDLLADPNFYFYLFNTGYLLLAMPFSIGGSLALAVYLTQKLEIKNGRSGLKLALLSTAISAFSALLLWMAGLPNAGLLVFVLGLVAAIGFHFHSIGYRTFFYLPHFTAGAGTILLWMQLYNPNFGLINQTLNAVTSALGLDVPAPGWLTSTRSLLGFLPFPDDFNNGGFGFGARESIMLMGIWGAIGGNNMILYLAGISNIPPELYEAADIDGASFWQRFRFITWPQLAPTTFFIVVMGMINGLQGGFEQARMMTDGGPAGTTTTLSYYIYRQGFERLDLGYGSAVAWVLFAIIMGITILNWKFGNREAND